MKLQLPALLGITTLIFLPTSPASARALEEVVVSAQKRDQSLQDVAISVAVISGDELARRNKTTIASLSKVVPGFTFATGTSDAGRNIIVRGVGTQSFSRSVDQSVGTVIDGVASASLSGSLLDFNDVERIEVLRGPQGTLFGKNASAGLLSITTKAPTHEVSGGLGLRYGSENLVNATGNLSGPIVEDRLLGRISAFSNSNDATLKNTHPDGEDMNDRNDWGLRAKLQWLVSDELDALFSYTHAERDQTCCIGPLRDVVPGSVADLEGGPRGPDADEIYDNDKSTGKTEVDMYSLEINYSLGDHVLTSITAYSEDDIFAAARGDLYGRTPLPRNDSRGLYEQFTQEFRITSPADQTVSYIAGLYYFDWELERNFTRVIDIYGTGNCPMPDCGSITVINDHHNTSESFSVFGQLTWNLSAAARLSVGARYNDDEISIDQTVSSLPGTIPEAPPGSISANTDDQAFSWRIIGEYDFAEDAMIYASIARGYKGPGSNSLPSGPSGGEVFVDPEIPTNYEVGIKSQWLDNRLRFNGALYYTEFKDFQASTQVPDAFPPIFFLSNAGELETQGVELELTYQLLENVFLHSALAYTDATFSDWQNAPCYSLQTAEQGCVDGVQDLSGADMPDSPDLAFNISADWYVPIPDQPFLGFVKGTYFWRDDVQYDTTNNPLHVSDSYGIFDLSLGIAARDQSYHASLYILNLFDNRYESSLSGQSEVGILTGQGLPYDAETRYGISLQMNF